MVFYPLAVHSPREEPLPATREEPPEEFFCPITQEKMVDPVVMSDGHTYERTAIMQVLKRPAPLSPMTREPLNPDFVVPNWNLRKISAEHDEQQERRERAEAELRAAAEARAAGSGLGDRPAAAHEE